MINKLLKNINVLFCACWRLVFKNFRFVLNFFVLGYVVLCFYSYTNFFIFLPILLLILSYYCFYIWNFKNITQNFALTDLEKGKYFFSVFFGTIGFLSVYNFTKILFPVIDITFVFFIWWFYVFIFIFKNKNKNFYSKFIFTSFFCFSFVSVIIFLFGFKNFDITIHNDFFKFSTVNEFYYVDQPHGWLTYLNKRLDKWSIWSPNFFSSMFEIYDLSTTYMYLNYFGLSDVFFLFKNTQVGCLISFSLLLIIFYFILQIIFFKYIFASFQYIFYFKKFDFFFIKLFEYTYYTISLGCICMSLPFFFKFQVIDLFVILEAPGEIFNSFISDCLLPIFDALSLKYEKAESEMGGLKKGTWIPFTSWLIVWSQVGLFFLNPWVWISLRYIFNTTHMFDFDDEAYSKPSGKYYNFWKFLKRSEGKIPQFLLPWRIAKRSWYTWFEDERDYYVALRWLPEYYHYLNQNALDYYEGAPYLKMSRQSLMHKLPLFFSTHLVFLREFESIWMDDLHFFYKVSDELDRNIAVQFFADLKILTPLLEAEGEKVRTTLEKLELDEGEEDEFIEAVEDLRFEDSLVAQVYFHNYSVIKYFDWINIANKRYIKQIPDAVSFYSQFWYSRFLRSQFGKAFITKPQYEHKKFLNNSYLLYFENNSTKNYYVFASFFPIASPVQLNYDFIPAFTEIPEYFYSYIISSISGSSYFNHIVYTDKSLFLNSFKVSSSTEISKFCLNFEYFLVEFLIDNLFIDFCSSYGFFQNDNFGTSNFGRAISSKFINFILSNGFLDLIYTSFFEGIFFQEFFYIFFRSFAFGSGDYANYYNQLFSFFFKNIYYANAYSIFENKFQFHDICLHSVLTFKNFDFNLLNFTWYELHTSNFPTENSSAPYKEFSINLATMFFQSKKFIDFDLNSTFDTTSLEFKESNIFVLFREAYAEQYECQINWSTDVLLLDQYNYSAYFSTLFLDLFCSVALNYKFFAQIVKKSINMNDVFFYLPTSKKLKVDLLAKQLDNLYGFAMTSNELIPKFMGFLDSDISFFGNIGNCDSAYSDLNITTSFEEYYNSLFFSDYRSFYSANFAISKFYNSFICTTNNFFYFSVFKPVSYRKNKYFSNVTYANSTLSFSNIVFSKFYDFSALHKFQLFDFWCLNYNFLFSSLVSFRFCGMLFKSSFKYQFFSNNKNAVSKLVSSKSANALYNFLTYFFRAVKLSKIIALRYLKYYYFFSFLYKIFRLCLYLFKRAFSIFYLVFQFRRVPFKIFKFQFYLSHETESNFDFNDRVFFFLNDSIFNKLHSPQPLTNFSYFKYSGVFFQSYFKKR